ncbi:hypothetical protein FRB95_007856 [Tulasnella sp. JGI-2019a]|nr:hypothetical protein FRB93_005248 [Tulasnella sp. JGI-2019a]KAG9027342.1 hypothetical protein FRB95_007856 [Tulasnella sp. JGI-2019a]
MTITKDLSAPLVVVVGATGNQGSSVIQALLESNKPYRVRGFTRDTSKPVSKELASQGVEMVAIEPKIGNKEQVLNEFKGANVVFALTLTDWKEPSKELTEGKMFVDAAKEAKVSLFVWSGIQNMTEVTGGKYTHVTHFDVKQEVTQYLRASCLHFVSVEPGSFMENYTTHSAPKKHADGESFVIYGVNPPDSVVPLINTKHDYGLFVRKAIEAPGKQDEIFAHGEVISLAAMAERLSETTGKKVTYMQISHAAFMAALTSRGFSNEIARSYLEMHLSVGEFGYFGKKDLGPSLEGLARAPRTWKQFVEVTDWSKILN